MAEENEIVEEKEAAKEKKSTMKWIVIAVLVVFIGVGGYVGWNAYAKMSRAETINSEKKAEAEKQKVGIVFPLRSFIVNLLEKSGIGKKYLKVTMEIEVGSEKDRTLVEKYTPQLTDTILLLLSSQSTDEINSLEGKLELKHTLQSRMNQVIGSSVVRKVYFTEFVVQ